MRPKLVGCYPQVIHKLSTEMQKLSTIEGRITLARAHLSTDSSAETSAFPFYGGASGSMPDF